MGVSCGREMGAANARRPGQAWHAAVPPGR